MLTLRSTVLPLVLGALLLSLSACKPDYPKCESDEHCVDTKEVCVNNFCKTCRDDSQCTVPGQYCSSNACTYKLGYCDDSRPCSGDQKCRDNMCGPACLDNTECGGNEFCNEGSCAVKPECGTNADNPNCQAGYECETGRCVQRLTECGGDPVYFAFGKSHIRSAEGSKIETIAECLKGDNVAPVVLGGHADEVGDEAFNLALSEDRSKEVSKRMERLGIDGGRMSIQAFGETQPAVSGSGSQPKNRRVEFTPSP